MSLQAERRRWPRLRPLTAGPVSQVRLRAGATVLVHDMSAHGARVRGAARLLPGVHADVHVVGAQGRQLLRGRVIWSRVRTLDPLIYESALAFDEALDLLREGYHVPPVAMGSAAAPEPDYPSGTGARRVSAEKP